LNTLSTTIKANVMHVMATMLTHAMTLMALVDFFALKYLQAKRKFKVVLSFRLQVASYQLPVSSYR
jgi:hypothetical protein